MDLALVSSDMEARRFQLWEATPHRVSGASAAAKRARSWPEPPRRCHRPGRGRSGSLECHAAIPASHSIFA
jgi:hypothetical protein